LVDPRWVSSTTMLHLLDANVLIDSARGYFQLDRVPQFWTWLVDQGGAGRIAIPVEIWEEFKEGDDLLGEWARTDSVKDGLLTLEDADPALVNEVVASGYAPDLTDDELIQLGRDPFLIAYALADPQHRRVVTAEVSKPTRIRGRRHVPDVCSDLGVGCVGIVDLINTLDFRVA